MKTLKKPFIVIWDITTSTIRLKMLDNDQTFVPDELEAAEFDTEQELNDFINQQELIEEETLIENENN